MSTDIFKNYTQGRPSVQGPVERVKLDQEHCDPHTSDVPGSFKWPNRDVRHVRNGDDK